MNSRTTPFENIIQSVKREGYLPTELIVRLPKHWRRVGTVGIIELHSSLWPWKEHIGQSYLSVLSELTTIVQKVGTTSTTIRTPGLELLAGNPNTVTLHKELGCKFWVDALRLTFSTGNHAERQRLIKITSEGEQIIDMFACVGNLSLPISVHHPTVQIRGIEINPYAHSFLEKNVHVNHLEERYQAILGDNQTHTPKNWADRVLMGYFELSPFQLEVALHALKQDQGGILHTHGLTTTKKSVNWREIIDKLIIDKFPYFKTKSIEQRIVKSIAPGVNHFVDDIHIFHTT
ncbi:MAG: class I SAM-dependent methyltransferase [Candidatus Hodarchaeales archaeon]